MTKLSVNINKIALIRNARGHNQPDIIACAQDIESYGADGITVHPRPDERHVKYSDLHPLKEVVKQEFNIEGYPDERFIKAVMEIVPHQVTLVPDPPDALTSDTGWDTVRHFDFLRAIAGKFQEKGIRVSIFIDPIEERIVKAKEIGIERIELYTGPYAERFYLDKEEAVHPFVLGAEWAHTMGIGINAGHDLNLHNLKYFKENVPHLLEVSIGHALICDALQYGMKNTVLMYLNELHRS